MRLSISLAQMEISTGDPETNLKKAEEWIAEAARRGSDVVVFPEMWTTGFDWDRMQPLADQSNQTVKDVAALAQTYGVWVNGSLLALDEAGRPTNTSIFFDSTGQQAGLYRKVHLFGLIAENKHLASGQSMTIVETPWGQAGLAICYDLRFPELFRSYAVSGAVMVYLPAEWPRSRLAHWQTLLRARAIENQLYMLGVNCVGHDSMTTFGGHSALIDPWGDVVIEGGESELLLTATIDTDEVARVREKIPVFNDRRPDIYRLG